MVEGALEFDGQDDMFAADLILDPADGPSSVLAWIKGGAPGQVIASQADARVGRNDRPGYSWFATDPALGVLTTDLASPEPIPPAPAVATTDGQWHLVGLVWDDSSETSALYVDDVELAIHLQPILYPSKVRHVTHIFRRPFMRHGPVFGDKTGVRTEL